MKKFSIPVVYEMTTYFETAVFEYNKGLTIDVGRPFENEFVFYECQNGHGKREAIDVIQYIAELADYYEYEMTDEDKLWVNKYLPEHLKY